MFGFTMHKYFEFVSLFVFLLNVMLTCNLGNLGIGLLVESSITFGKEGSSSIFQCICFIMKFRYIKYLMNLMN